jgi:hypothetical protein
MDDKTRISWENFLNPASLRANLIVASIYIAAYEILKDAIVDRIRDFFTNGFDESGWRLDPKYQSQVLSTNRSPVYASLAWLKERDAIDDADLVTFERVKELRNKLAHGLKGILYEGPPADFAERLSEMITLLDKIERWWIVNVEIATDPDLHDKEIDETMVIPGPTMWLRLLLDIALGSEEESKKYIDEFMKQTGQNPA